MAKEKSLISSLLPVCKLKRATLTDGADGKLNIDLDINILLEKSNNYLSAAFNPPDFNYNGLGDGPFSKIKDHINFAVVLRRYKTDIAIQRPGTLKNSIRNSVADGNNEKGYPHVVGFSNQEFSRGRTEREFSEQMGRQEDEVIYLDSIFKQQVIGAQGSLVQERYDDAFYVEDTSDSLISKISRTVQIHGVYPKNLDNLRVVVYSYLDLKDFIGSVPELAALDIMPPDARGYGLDQESVYYKTVSGFGSFDVILENSLPSGRGYALLTPDGDQYHGPYHTHSTLAGGVSYMAGEAMNINVEQETLTKVEVNTNKIQDFRGLERFEPKPPESRDLLEQFGAVIQDSKKQLEGIEKEFLKKQHKFDGMVDAEIQLQTATAPELDDRPAIFGSITVNQGQILKQNSRLGYLYPYLSAQQKSFALWWGDMFRVVEVKLLRRRLTDRFVGWDANGFKDRKLFDEDTPEEVIASNYEELKFDLTDPEGQQLGTQLRNTTSADYYDPNTLVVPRGEFATVTTDALFFPETNDSVKGLIIDSQNWLNTLAENPNDLDARKHRDEFNKRENHSNPDTNDTYFPWRRTFNFADASFTALKEDHRGVFQYGIEITYEDGLVKYVTEIVAKMTRLTSFLNSFVSLVEAESKETSVDGTVVQKIARSIGFQSYNLLMDEVIDSYSQAIGIIDSLNYVGTFAQGGGINKTNHPILDNTMGEFQRSLVLNEGGSSIYLSLGTGAWRNYGYVILRSYLKQVLNYNRDANIYAKELKTFGQQFGIIAHTLSDLINFSNSIYGGTISDLKSNGGKPASLIKVKKFFGDNPEQQAGLVSGGVVDLRNTKVPTCSILPRGEVSIQTPVPIVEQEMIRQAISLESVKFGGGDVSQYADRVAYFTPNIFYGSNILDLWSTTGGYSSLTYDRALDSLNTVYSQKKRANHDQYDASREQIKQSISPGKFRDKALRIAQDDFEKIKSDLLAEYLAKVEILKSRQENGEFSDEDFAMIEDFDVLGNNQKLEIANMVTKLLRNDRGFFVNLDDKTPEQIAELSRQLFNRGEDFPGVAAVVEIIGEQLPNEVEVPSEEECSALSDSQIKALTHNQRVEFTESVLEQEFTGLQQSFTQEFTAYVDTLSSTTAAVDDNATIDTSVTSDTSYIKDIAYKQKQAFIQEQKIKERQRAEEYMRIAEEAKRKQKEREEKKAAIASGELTKYPFQIEKVINGDTDYGLGKGNKMNPAVYGNFYVLKRRVLDKEASNKARTNIYKMVEVSIADALDGLEPGHYAFVPFETSALAKSGKYILDTQHFVIKKPKVTQSQKATIKKAEEKAAEEFEAKKQQEVEELQKEADERAKELQMRKNVLAKLQKEYERIRYKTTPFAKKNRQKLESQIRIQKDKIAELESKDVLEVAKLETAKETVTKVKEDVQKIKQELSELKVPSSKDDKEIPPKQQKIGVKSSPKVVPKAQPANDPIEEEIPKYKLSSNTAVPKTPPMPKATPAPAVKKMGSGLPSAMGGKIY